MADQETTTKKSGWFKAFIGTVTGLCSGAAVMYLTPLVDNAIKPAKPVANFKVEHDGLNVRIQNLSNVRQGYWDFGDGSPLEPVTADDYLTHAYPEAATYTVKLTLQNILNEENDRSVAVKLDGPTTPGTPNAPTTAAAQGPQITKFEAVPLIPGNLIAPASFELNTQVQNATLCVLTMGDGRTEIAQDGPLPHDVTFAKPGRYTLKLIAVKGNLREEKSVDVMVTEPPLGVAKAVVTVTDSGKRSFAKTTRAPFWVHFPQSQKENVFKIEREVKASMSGGYIIADVRIPLPDNKEIRMGTNTDVALDANAMGQKSARNLRLTLSPDRKSLKLTGELVRDNLATPPTFNLPVELTEQRDIDANPTEMKLTRLLGLPGSPYPSADTIDLPRLAPGLSAANRQVKVEVDDGAVAVFQTSQLPASQSIMVQNRQVVVTARRINDQVSVSLTPGSAIQQTGYTAPTPPVSTAPLPPATLPQFPSVAPAPLPQFQPVPQAPVPPAPLPQFQPPRN
jgi:PKD repeat protein